jgi:hypothetical protein
MSGCGPHYLLQSLCTFRSISGRRVVYRLTSRSGTSSTYTALMIESNTQRGELRWECFCKQWHLFAKLAHKLFSYPLAFSLVILPLSAARWLLLSHKNLPSAAFFFGLSTYNLSGAVNVLLFFIIRPQLLLFSPPQVTVEF